MNTRVLNGLRLPAVSARLSGPLRPRRLAVAVLLLVLAAAPGELGQLTRSLMADAYVQVSVFVAATLLLFYGAERLFRFDIGLMLNRARGAQVPLAALLGTTPGCGGAVVVVAAYSSGHVGMGAVVATLTATMGDAAFLLIATRPDAAMAVLPLSFATGIVSGWIVDRIDRGRTVATVAGGHANVPRIGRVRAKDIAYLMLAAPGLIVGAAQIGQVSITHMLGVPVLWPALAGSFLGLAIWAGSPLNAMTNPADPPVTRMSEETSFISVWVIGAYLAYDYAATFLGLDLQALFQAIAPLLPLMGVLVGLIPGCGPQVLTATLYINGVIPFSALLGNAISNDGDALFPAIALAPRAAVLATLYSSVPALILAYGFYFFAPGFMN